ncbi:phosphoadenosine phosphosulfate reductase [Desulfovibrionales bacterium]
MSAITLDEKVDQAISRIEIVLTACQDRPVAVAWTGGKDSTVALHILQQVLARRNHSETAPILALHIDTGHKFSEILIFRDVLAAAWNLDLRILRPTVETSCFSPDIDTLACCAALKIAPLKAAITELGIAGLITGLRADEHLSRANRSWHEPHIEPLHLRCHPILDFTEMDVWAYTFDKGLPYCPLYDQGYRSLGCQPCTAPPSQNWKNERDGRAPKKEKMLSLLYSLGYF